jgi:hypothetical protein
VREAQSRRTASQLASRASLPRGGGPRRSGPMTRVAASAGTRTHGRPFPVAAIERWSATAMRARKDSRLESLELARVGVSAADSLPGRRKGARTAEPRSGSRRRRAQIERKLCALAPRAPVASMPNGILFEGLLHLHLSPFSAVVAASRGSGCPAR